ncbi:MAG: tol-pal system YbgF family protein [Acidiferrobacterales bacterium]
MGARTNRIAVTERLRPHALALSASLVLAALSSPLGASELERVVAVARGGATELALRLLDKYQPPGDQRENWTRWEKERLAILAQKRRWDDIARRVDELPSGLPEPFVRWAQAEAAKSQLAAEDGVAARKYLRRLLWGRKVDAKQFAKWRRMVIRSYVIENNITDANTALLRYKQDYRVNNDAWRLLHAKVLLRVGRNKNAFDVLQQTQSTEGRTLRSLAGLRSGIYKAPAVKAEGLKVVEATARKPQLQRTAWMLVAEAAAKISDDAYRVIALERAIALSTSPASSRDQIFRLSADDLWQAYQWLAERLGNRMHLLVGNDDAWMEQAQYYESEEQSYARAFYAFMAQRGSDPKVRRLAHTRLADSLFKDNGAEVVRWLYTRSKQFDSLEAIPDTVRYKLADEALKRRDIHFAARLLKGLDKPPPGEDPEQWSLRRARVLIYAGDFRAAALWLSQILDHKRSLDSPFADRYVQVLFDLQAVDKHVEAYALLDSVFSLTDNAQQRREILFWMADSKSAMGEYQQAGELYLRSASFGKAGGADPWGHTARFRAAEALGKAGLVADARGVYRKLLEQTVDQRRRALIERNIQQLWLREQQTTPQ